MYPNLPNFSSFFGHLPDDPSRLTGRGRDALSVLLRIPEEECGTLEAVSPEIDPRLKKGTWVSSNFVIPYPPGFPSMVPASNRLANERVHAQAHVKEIHVSAPPLGLIAESGFLAIGQDADATAQRRQHEAEASAGTRCRLAPPHSRGIAGVVLKQEQEIEIRFKENRRMFIRAMVSLRLPQYPEIASFTSRSRGY